MMVVSHTMMTHSDGNGRVCVCVSSDWSSCAEWKWALARSLTPHVAVPQILGCRARSGRCTTPPH
jgi:hypothetical protein